MAEFYFSISVVLYQLFKQGEVAIHNFKDQISFLKIGIKSAAACVTFFTYFFVHYFNKIIKRKKVQDFGR